MVIAVSGKGRNLTLAELGQLLEELRLEPQLQQLN